MNYLVLFEPKIFETTGRKSGLKMAHFRPKFFIFRLLSAFVEFFFKANRKSINKQLLLIILIFWASDPLKNHK